MSDVEKVVLDDWVSAIQKSIDSLEIYCGCTFVARVYTAITTDSKANTVSFCFGWAYGSDDATVSDCAIGWNIFMYDELYGIRTCWHTCTHPLYQAT